MGQWVYALSAPFTTIDDGVAAGAIEAAWSGKPTAPLSNHKILLTTDTLGAMTAVLGTPTEGATRVVDEAELFEEARRSDGWMIVPFDKLQPHMKVLQIDGLSPLDKALDLNQWPLTVHLEVPAPAPEGLDIALTNRDLSRMNVLAMTGVTALTRGTSAVIERKGPTYPGRDVADLLRSADLTHISNEVSFTPNCPRPHPRKTMSFCAHDSYIELLDFVGADIIELTGNHNNDYGRKWSLHSMDLYEQRGWKWFGGGRNLAEASSRTEVDLGQHRLAFMGCNPVGGRTAWATVDQPGAMPCREREDFDKLVALVRQAKADGFLPIVTMQYWETYKYYPTPNQKKDFYALAEAGAVFVSGSQAHQAQGFGLPKGSFIHFGPGNLFFDQMQSLGTRQEFVDFLTFYDGRLLNVTLHTLLLEEYARPRPMTPAERARLLKSTFAVTTW